MAVDLLDSLREDLSDDVVANLAAALGETQASMRQAVDAAAQAILARLGIQASNRQDAGHLFRTLRDSGLDGSRIGAVAATLRSGEATRQLLDLGGPLMADLFDIHLWSAVEWLSSHASISRSSAESVLGLLSPLVMDALAKRASSTNSFRPEALARMLASHESSPFEGVRPSSVHSAPAADASMQARRPSSRRLRLEWMVWSLPVVLVGGLWQVSANRPSSSTTTSGGAAGPVLPVDPGPSVRSAYGADLGPIVPRLLPDGALLRVPKRGVESRLISFIDDAARPLAPELWFTLDRTEFATDSASLSPQAWEQLNDLARILKAFPTVTIRIGGFTEMRGSASANVKLSAARAQAAVDALIAFGVDESRLEAEGYGEARPIARNDTDVGRRLNRRLDVHVSRR